MGRSGVDVWRIQALDRHRSNAILGYLEDSHHGHLVSVAVEAQLQQSIQEVRNELRILQAATRGRAPAAPASSSSATREPASEPAAQPLRYVECTRPNGRVHSVDPHRPGFTFCNWRWGKSAHARSCATPFGSCPGTLRCPDCVAGIDSDSESSLDA